MARYLTDYVNCSKSLSYGPTLPCLWSMTLAYQSFSQGWSWKFSGCWADLVDLVIDQCLVQGSPSHFLLRRLPWLCFRGQPEMRRSSQCHDNDQPLFLFAAVRIVIPTASATLCITTWSVVSPLRISDESKAWISLMFSTLAMWAYHRLVFPVHSGTNGERHHLSSFFFPSCHGPYSFLLNEDRVDLVHI